MSLYARHADAAAESTLRVIHPSVCPTVQRFSGRLAISASSARLNAGVSRSLSRCSVVFMPLHYAKPLCIATLDRSFDFSQKFRLCSVSQFPPETVRVALL